MRTLKLIFLLLFLGYTGLTCAQDSTSTQAHEVAKKLANPNAVLGFMAFPIDYITYKGSLPGANSQSAFKVNFQPSLPYPVAKGTNVFLRPLVPVIIQQPVFNGAEFQNEGLDLGDIGFDLAIGKTWESKWLTLAGLVVSAPTATKESLGANQWSLGPEIFVGKTMDWGFLGVLVNHAWGLYDSDELNLTAGQYFYTVHLENAWQIQAQPTFSYNHNGSSGNQLNIPLATGLAKTYIFGSMPIKFSVQYWYYVEAPDTFGSQHQIRFSIIPVIPLPW
jgi:hypothetical protein